MNRPRLRLTRTTAIAGAVTLLLGTGTAVAAAAVMSSPSPVSSSGVIDACWTNAAVNGSHIIVLQNQGTTCPSGTTPIQWNEQGPSGAPGPTGPSGPPGSAGAAGSPGPTGPSGPAGAPGPSGPSGPAGSPGANGSPGAGAVVADSAPNPPCSSGGITVTDGSGDIGYVCNGATGSPGPSGPSGPAGSPGPDGSPGTGATVAALATGDANCPNGGASITDGNGDVAYACNGATGPAGPAGTTGQNSFSAYSTSSLTVPNDTSGSYTEIPGLTVTFTEPSGNPVVLVSTDGGVATNSEADLGYSYVDIEVFVDGRTLPPSEWGGLSCGVEAMNTDTYTTSGAYGVQNWALQSTIPYGAFLAGSTHTITVAAAGLNFGGGASATVGGDSSSFLQGNLTVTILNT
jgi:hypothetical protein